MNSVGLLDAEKLVALVLLSVFIIGFSAFLFKKDCSSKKSLVLAVSKLDVVAVLCWLSGCVVTTRFKKTCSSSKSSDLALEKHDAVVLMCW